MLELLYNPFYSIPLGFLVGCGLALVFSNRFYLPKVKFVERKIQEKARELYSTAQALEKTRYELVMLASDANEQYKWADKAHDILENKNTEIKLLKEEIELLENSLFNRSNVFNIRSNKTTQDELTRIRAKYQQNDAESGAANQRKTA
jgi:hypothetical protein